MYYKKKRSLNIGLLSTRTLAFFFYRFVMVVRKNALEYIIALVVFPHLVMWSRYCACEILVANPIDWLFAACLEYLIFFSIDSSEARKQYDRLKQVTI
jgi:hypothetical protein